MLFVVSLAFVADLTYTFNRVQGHNKDILVLYRSIWNIKANEFMDGVPVHAIIDKDNILDQKESPSDNPAKWRHLIKNNIYKLR